MIDPDDQNLVQPALELLGLDDKATGEQVRQAYLRTVAQYPPDQAAEMFEKVRDAYNILRDPRTRARRVLGGPDGTVSLLHFMDDRAPRRTYVGPEAWLTVLKEKQ